MTEAIQRAPSVARLLADRVATTPAAEAFRWPVAGADGVETWQSMTWARTGSPPVCSPWACGPSSG